MPRASATDFREIQQDFAAYLRRPEEVPIPAGVAPERAALYRELVFNNIKSFLDNNFPVLSKLLGEARWQSLAEQFVAEHACQTPYFLEIGREFLTWLRESGNRYLADMPCAEELAHYEWTELAVAVAEDDPVASFAAGALLDNCPLVSANAWPLRYDFPVHRIGPDFIPDEPPSQQTFLTVYRDRDFDVQFMEINAITWLLLERLREPERQSARQVLEQLAADFPSLTIEQVVGGGEQTLQELVSRGIIIGSHNPEPPAAD